MKRLTTRDVNIESKRNSYSELYMRLRELENQIEDGILVDCENYYVYVGDDGHICMKRNNIFPEIYDLTLLCEITTIKRGEEYVKQQKSFRAQYTYDKEEHK